MPNRALTIALRLDTSDHDAGIQRSIEGERTYAREQVRVNAEMKNAFDRLGETRSRAMSGEGLMGRGLINWKDQETRLAEFGAAQARVARAVDAQDAAISRQRVGRALNDYQVRVSLEERYYAATHTQQEVALNNLQNYYARLRAQHVGNAQMLAQIDRNYAAERQAMMSQMAAGRFGGSAFGGERGLSRLGRGLGSAVGASGIGGQAGGLLGMALGGTEAAALAGFAAVGVTVGAIASKFEAHLTQMREIQQGYNQDLRESAKWWENIGARRNTALGHAAGERASTLREKATELGEAQTTRENQEGFGKGWLTEHGGGIWGEYGEMFDEVVHGGAGPNTWKSQEDRAEMQRRGALRQEAAKLDAIRDAGIERQQGRDVADWRRRASESQTGTMYASPARQRQELSDRLAREKEELRRKQEDERLDLEARATVAKTPAEKVAVKKLQDALGPNQAAELQSADLEAANRKKALERDLREEQIREADRTADLRVVAGKRGYAREEAALAEHYRQEIAAAERAGDTVKKAELEAQRGLAAQAQRDNRDEEARKEHVALSIREAQATGQYAEALKQARAEEARQTHEKYNDPALEKQHMDDYDKVQAAERAEGVRKTHVDNQIKLMEATGHYRTALSLAREEQERQYRALGYTDDQVKQLMADWDKLKQAQADHSGLEAIKGLNIELERQMGHITALEAERQRLRQANPLASQSVIDEQAQKSEELRLRKQFESPAQKFQKFSGDVAAALNHKGAHGEDDPLISKGRAEIEIRNELRSLMGPSGEGKMSDMSSRWSEIQNAVNEPAQLTADEQRAFWSELTAMWKAGIKIRM